MWLEQIIFIFIVKKNLVTHQSETKFKSEVSVFARHSVYAIARICYRPSVRLSVTRVDQSKTAEVRIMQLSPPGSPMTLVSSWLTSPRNSKGNLGSEGAKYERGRKNTQFSANKSPYLSNGAR